MNKKIFIAILIIVATIAAIWFFLQQPKDNIGAKNYIGHSAEECSRIQVLCVEGFERFDDEAGCGCQEVFQ